jgi:hypothetical protein
VALSQAEEVVEHLGLHDLRRLRHPDPIRDPGQLHGRGHRHEIPVALRQRLVHVDEPVFERLAEARDLGRGGVGQLGRRGDEDGAGVELEDAGVVDQRRETPDEPDVARPEEALLPRPTWRREEPHAAIMVAQGLDSVPRPSRQS